MDFPELKNRKKPHILLRKISPLRGIFIVMIIIFIVESFVYWWVLLR